MAGLLEIEPIVLALIGIGSFSIVMGFIMFGKLNSSNKKTEKKSLLDENYFENFKVSFESTKSIEGALEQLAEIYAGKNIMQDRIQKALKFIQEDYGDYETALEMINVEGNEGVHNLHRKAILSTLNKNEKQNAKPIYQIPTFYDYGPEEIQPKSPVAGEADVHFEETATQEEDAEEDGYDLGEGYAAFLDEETEL